MSSPLTRAFCVLTCLGSWAQAQLVSGIWGYSITNEPGTGAQVVIIREYKGAGGFAVVPSVIDGMAVRTVGGGFGQLDRFNTNKITGIEIPDSVSTIADYAFWQCSSLASVSLGNGIKTTGYGAFAYCTALTNVILPDSLTSLGNYTFYRASFLTNVTFGAGLKNIGIAALSDNPRLRSLVLPSGLTNIGNYAFNNNTGMTNIAMQGGVTTIGSYAFGNNDGLTNIVIPDTVTTIGDRAFEQSAILSSVNLGQGLVSLGAGAFWICDGLTNQIIPNGVKELAKDLFFDCANLASVIVGWGVTNVGQGAFGARSNLASVVFKGNAPSLVYSVVTTTNNVTTTNFLTHTNVFGTNSFPTVFFLPGATGWGPVFAGRTTHQFVPVAVQSSVSGVGQFSFAWAGTAQVPMNVQRRESLAGGTWSNIAIGLTNSMFVDSNTPTGAAYYRSVLP